METRNHITLNGKNYPIYETNWEQLSCEYGTTPWWKAICGFLAQWANPSNSIQLKTSGSTGKPKTIEAPKQYLVNSALRTNEFFHLTDQSSALLCLSAEYIAGQMMLVRAMVSGLNLICVQPTGNPLTHLNQSVDFAAMVPMQLIHCINQKSDLSVIKNLIIGGGQLPISIIASVQPSNIAIYETFGMTETYSHIALKQITPTRSDYFVPLRGVELTLSDAGTLTISAPHLGIQQLSTTDVVEFGPHGQFKWKGRADFVINSGGVKIHPEEVEKILSPFVTQPFCITSVTDAVLGEKVVLVIEQPNLEESELLELFRKHLPTYSIPKKVIGIEKLPLTENQKVDHHKVRNLLINSAL